MREILFRGKQKNNNKWCYGYLFDDGMADSVRMFVGGIGIEDYKGTADDEFNITGIDFCEVDPETVCQYTGLKDKNGRKIFEGDILGVCTFGFNPERFVTEVIFDKCAFRLKNGRNMFYYGQSDFTKMDDAKIIGNIFDNPELIGE